MRPMTRVLLPLLFAVSLSAQTWDTVRALRPGDAIRVQETGGVEHRGTVAAVMPESISISDGKQQISIERSRVRQVKVKSGARRGRNIAIGAAVGLAVGLTADQTLGQYFRNESGQDVRPLYYVLPIGIFGGIGAALSPYRTVYRVK